MRNVDFTFREILISIIIALLMVGLGFFIAESIQDKVTSGNEKYFKAFKVEDKNLFDYAIRTQVGDILSYGEIKANEPVSDDLIKGKYFAIDKREEHYTMHTRTVSYKCGKLTCYRTETYWTWDEIGRKQSNTKTFTYLGKKFDYDKVNFNNYIKIDTVNAGYHVRFIFYAIPEQFKGTLYSKAKDGTIYNNELYSGKKIKDVINEKEGSADQWVIIFWIVWIILILMIVILFMTMENKYI